MNLVALIAAITALVAAVGGVLHSLGVGRNVAKHLALHRQFRTGRPTLGPQAENPPSSSPTATPHP